MHQRAFVVFPLLELIADPVLPDGTRLLDARLSDQPATTPPTAGGLVMTGRRTCLRCDWQGETTTTCPTCAAPLYAVAKQPSEGAGAEVRGHPEERSREAASTAIVAPSAAPPRPSSPPPPQQEEATSPRPHAPGRSSPPSSRSSSSPSRSARGSTRTGNRREPLHSDGGPQPSRLTGSLVYAVPDGTGHSRLWRYDLETETATPGPRVPRATSWSTREASTRWLGLTTALPNGQVQASILRFHPPDDRSTPMLEGDVVSWGPQGRTVAAGRRGPLRVGCRRSVSIV